MRKIKPFTINDVMARIVQAELEREHEQAIRDERELQRMLWDNWDYACTDVSGETGSDAGVGNEVQAEPHAHPSH